MKLLFSLTTVMYEVRCLLHIRKTIIFRKQLFPKENTSTFIFHNADVYSDLDLYSRYGKILKFTLKSIFSIFER